MSDVGDRDSVCAAFAVDTEVDNGFVTGGLSLHDVSSVMFPGHLQATLPSFGHLSAIPCMSSKHENMRRRSSCIFSRELAEMECVTAKVKPELPGISSIACGGTRTQKARAKCGCPCQGRTRHQTGYRSTDIHRKE
jgi:hypothetical protein